MNSAAKPASEIDASCEPHLRAISDARSVLDRARHQRNRAAVTTAQHHVCTTVEAARAAGVTWMQIGDLLDIARGNAYQRYRTRPADSRDSQPPAPSSAPSSGRMPTSTGLHQSQTGDTNVES